MSYSASTEMLGNRQLPVLIEACSKIVDYVIIDTPPSGMIGDAQIFAQHADAVMVVARQNVTLAEDINEMMDDFRDNHTKVLGVVLNGVMTFQSIADSRWEIITAGTADMGDMDVMGNIRIIKRYSRHG